MKQQNKEQNKVLVDTVRSIIKDTIISDTRKEMDQLQKYIDALDKSTNDIDTKNKIADVNLQFSIVKLYLNQAIKL